MTEKKRRGRPPKKEEKVEDVVENIVEDNLGDNDVAQIESHSISLPEDEEGDIEVRGLTSTGADLFDFVAGGGFPWGKIINIVGDSSSGKCARDMYILTGEGFEYIDNIGADKKYGTTPLCQSVCQGHEYMVNTSHFYKESVNRVYRIKTRHGFCVEATPDHPIAVFDPSCNIKMVPTNQLKIGDYCAIQRGTNIYSDVYREIKAEHSGEERTFIVDENFGSLLGYFVADGNFVPNGLIISTSKKWAQKEIIESIYHIFNKEVKALKHRINISGKEIRKIIAQITEKSDGFTARYKYVPQLIMQSPRSVQVAFLRALIDCDGYQDGTDSIEYYTASYRLVREAQLMLLNIGIVASIREKDGAWARGKYYDHTYYNLRIGKSGIELYRDVIGSRKYRFDNINCKSSSDYDSIPYLVSQIKGSIDLLRTSMGWSPNGICKKGGRFPRFKIASALQRGSISYDFLRDFMSVFEGFKCFKLFNYDLYENIMTNNYHYDPIVSIEQIDEEVDVFDFHIPDTHLFYGNGFLNHNTLVASEFIAKAHKTHGEDLEWFYDDAEAGYAFDSKTIWGIDIVAPDAECSNTLEDFQANLTKRLQKLKPDKRLIYILDSFDSLTSDDEIEFIDKKMKARENEKKEKGTYGTSKAKGMSQFFRSLRREIKTKNCILLIVSQVRENIGVMYGPKYSRMGGKALDFYPAQVFWLAVAEKHYIKNRCIGITIKVMNTKNKIGKPYREGFLEVLFDYGVDNIASDLLYLYDLKTEKGKNKEKLKTTKLLWGEKEYSFRQLVRHIETHNLERELSLRTKNKWYEIEYEANTMKGRKAKF